MEKTEKKRYNKTAETKKRWEQNTCLRLTTSALLLLYLTGCQIVTTTDRVNYEDGTPVEFAQVHEWNDEWSSITQTDEDGTWHMNAPAGAMIHICITEWDRGIGTACYDGLLQVPYEDGSLGDANLTRRVDIEN